MPKPKQPKTQDTPAHAERGASSAYRWMACPGSVRMCRDLPDRRSIWAAEGTAAHKLGEVCLTEGHDPAVYKGEAIFVEDFDEPFIVDDDMIDAVRAYLDHIHLIFKKRAVAADFTAVEQRVSLSAYADGPDDILNQMFGTADYVRYLSRESTLLVIDYKHGAGVEVLAEGNAQSRYYALGALALPELKKRRVDKIEIHIVQPRARPDYPVSVETLDVVDLIDWSNDLFAAARRTQEPDAPLVPGDHCRFCGAQALCPAVRDKRMAQAQLMFQDQRIQPAVEAPDKLSLDDLRMVLDSASDITAWINAAQKLAHDMLESGLDVPGYKLVAKRALRQWRDEQQSANWLCLNYGLGDDDLYEKKIKSPAKIEKLLDAKGKRALKETDLITAESSGNTLAPESDKRPAVAGRATPSELFEPVD